MHQTNPIQSRNIGILSLLTILAVITLFLRFYQLGSVPLALYQDESAIGYNAYSILQTGLDEHGDRTPLYFKSFGDYKLPVYVYLTAGSIKIFGMNEFAVRLPSAVFGSISIAFLFFLIYNLTKKFPLAYISALFLSINPQHIFFSRAGFEVNVAVSLVLISVYLFILALEKKRTLLLLLSVLGFGLAFYSYNLTRMFVPILVSILLISNRHKIKEFKLLTILSVTFLGILLSLPFLITFFTPSGVASAGGVLITSQDITAKNVELRSYLIGLPSVYIKLFFNKYILMLFQYFANIASIFSGPFFFVQGTNHGNQGLGNVGFFYIYNLPFLIYGLITFIRMKISSMQLFLTWLITNVLILALSKDIPHATRGYFLVVPVVVFSALGFISFTTLVQNYYSNKKIQYILFTFLGIIMLYNIQFFVVSYFYRFPIVYAKEWRYADKNLALYLSEHSSKYTNIIIDPAANFSYTSLLFYTKYDPEDFISSATRAPDGNLITVSSFGKYIFRPIEWESDIIKNNVLLITNDQTKIFDKEVVAIIKNPIRNVVLSVNEELMQFPVEDNVYILIESK